MTKKGKKGVNDVLREAQSKIRDQLHNSVQAAREGSGRIRENVKDRSKELGDKVSETAKDTKASVKENADNIATMLSLMLLL